MSRTVSLTRARLLDFWGRLRGRSGGDWHRRGIGGAWDAIGRLQFDFMVAHGLEPRHHLLDVGCGPLRGGVHFIRYLDAGHYCGIDKERWLLASGARIELARSHLEDKRPRLILTSDFDLSSVPAEIRFDRVLAQSVFTHLAPELIALCLRRVLARLAPDGRFFASFYEAGAVELGKRHSWRDGELRRATYPVAALEAMAREAGGAVEYLGDWGHPSSRMLAIRLR
jgi:SAM-dependent methyltransferase